MFMQTPETSQQRTQFYHGCMCPTCPLGNSSCAQHKEWCAGGVLAESQSLKPVHVCLLWPLQVDPLLPRCKVPPGRPQRGVWRW
jgi:hypothetical protein